MEQKPIFFLLARAEYILSELRQNIAMDITSYTRAWEMANSKQLGKFRSHQLQLSSRHDANI